MPTKSEISHFIRVQSAKFKILPGEEEELFNEDTYGKAVATYLQPKLIEYGYNVPFFVCEDWGWWVEIKGQPFVLGVLIYGWPMEDGLLDACVCVSEEPGQFWSWLRFKYIDRTPRVKQLEKDLIQIFKSDDEVKIVGITEDFPLGGVS